MDTVLEYEKNKISKKKIKKEYEQLHKKRWRINKSN